jgi:hypothetical protein
MKKIVPFAIAFIFSVITGYSQTSGSTDSAISNKVKEPEFVDVFFLLDSATGNLTDLERQTLKVKFHPHGFGGTESDLQLKGAKSPVRFRQGQSLEFIVRASSSEVDPVNLVTLYSLESGKSDRKLVVGHTGYMQFRGKIELDKSEVPFNAVKYGESSFKIKAAQSLSPGEYVLLTKDAKEGFAFGVD